MSSPSKKEKKRRAVRWGSTKVSDRESTGSSSQWYTTPEVSDTSSIIISAPATPVFELRQEVRFLNTVCKMKLVYYQLMCSINKQK